MPPRRRKRRHRLRRLFLLLLLALLAFVGYEAWTWPDIAVLARRNPPTTAFIESYRARQRAAGRDDRVLRVFAPYGAIAPSVKRAISSPRTSTSSRTAASTLARSGTR